MNDDKARLFTALHIAGNPLVLFNIWDVGSARAVEAAGARAIATASHAVAEAQGFADGEKLPLSDAIANLRRIVAATDLPVTIDLESGYGRTPDAVAAAVFAAIEAGAVGFNLEDQIIGGEGLYPVDEQSDRVAAARGAAERAGVPAYINARTDLFLKGGPDAGREGLLDEALARGRAYKEAGASGLFVPGLADEGLIARLCRESALPVNIFMRAGGLDSKRLAALGVARLSYGPGAHKIAMKAVEDAARAAFS